MSDDLTIGSPSTIGVHTSELVAGARQLRMLQLAIADSSARITAIDVDLPATSLYGRAPTSAMLAESAIADARVALGRALQLCDVIAGGLSVAAEGYAFADRFAERIVQEAWARVAHGVGFWLPFIAMAVLPGILTIGGGLGAAWLGLSEKQRERVLGAGREWLSENEAALSDPAVVELVRMIVMNADDFGMGLAKVPPEIAHLAGDEGVGLLGIDTSAAVLGWLAAGAGLLRETPVRVHAARVSTASPVHGAEDRALRIPSKPSQIRIDRYREPGKPDRFEVYVAGTADTSLRSRANPWDMTSNVAAMAEQDAGSYRALEEAMRLAGVTEHSPVTVTGHSQGGLLAARLAASGDYTVEGIITFGPPVAQIEVPTDIPYLVVEHREDLVPAFGGTWKSDPLLVRRSLFDGGPVPTGESLPAHALAGYRETARLIDSSQDNRLTTLLRGLEPSGNAEVRSVLYRATRAQD